MISPELPPNEDQRLAALRALSILDTPPEARFDRLTRLAQHLFEVPIALVSLIDENRQWFKSCQGLAASETPRSISFCGHAILQRDVFVVEDALLDRRFFDNPVVVGEPHVRFYAGAPLILPNGHPVGTLCIIAPTPRRFSERDRQLLSELGDCVIAELDDVHLAERERDLRLFIESAGAFIVAFDESGLLLQVNRACTEALGFSSAQLCGRPVTECIVPEQHDACRHAMQAALASPTAVPLETVLLARDDREISISGTLLAQRSPSGQTVIRGVFQDVTARKHLDRLRSEIVHHVSHELKTPLTSAVFALDLLTELSETWPEEARQTLEVARLSVRHATQMAADLMDAGRSESGKLRVEPVPGDLGNLMGLVHAAMQPLAHKAGLTLVTREPQPPIRACFDPARLRQVLGNLVGNALKFTPAGGRVDVETVPGDHGFVVVRVRDTGPGIAAEDQARLFDRLYQARSKVQKGEVGLGLGLFICRELVVAQGGRLWVESVPGQGATFCFTLPLA